MARKVKSVIIWATVADAAKALTTSFVETAQAIAWHSTRTAEHLILLVKGGATDPTSIDLIVEASPDGGTTGYLLGVQSTISTGIIDWTRSSSPAPASPWARATPPRTGRPR